MKVGVFVEAEEKYVPLMRAELLSLFLHGLNKT